MKVAITTSSFGEFASGPLDLLKERGLELAINPFGRSLTPEETLELLQGCAGVLAGTEKYSREILQALPELKVISRCGAGVDGIDQTAAKELGVEVLSTPDAPTQAVAELVLALALDLVRGISRQDRAVRAGRWQKQMGGLIGVSKVGIVGMGRIGRAVAEKFTALGATCAYSDPYVEGGTCPRLDLDELLAWAEIITLHVPGGKAPLLDARRIALLREGAFVINCARGGVVDEAALYQRLAAGSLGGAALDVFAKEPYHGPLSGLENVVLTPHIGSYAKQTRIEMEHEAAANLLSGLNL